MKNFTDGTPLHLLNELRNRVPFAYWTRGGGQGKQFVISLSPSPNIFTLYLWCRTGLSSPPHPPLLTGSTSKAGHQIVVFVEILCYVFLVGFTAWIPKGRHADFISTLNLLFQMGGYGLLYRDTGKIYTSTRGLEINKENLNWIHVHSNTHVPHLKFWFYGIWVTLVFSSFSRGDMCRGFVSISQRDAMNWNNAN